MNTKNELLQLINLAKAETDNLSKSSSYFNLKKDPILTTRDMLDWLERDISQDSNPINPDLIRRFKMQGIAAFKEYENTLLETYINKILNILPLISGK